METTNLYETDALLNEYLLMHYGSDEDVMPWGFGPKSGLGFTHRTVAHFPQVPCRRALDLGCAVGSSTFALSRCCDEVVGLDYSHSFIDAAERIRKQGELAYQIHETGNKYRSAVAKLPAAARPEAVKFQQGDATDLPDELGSFCRVHAANLLCRLPDPCKLLEKLPSLVRPEGNLVLATPCTWLDEYTPRDEQPGGDTFAWLRGELDSNFELLSQHDEPFVIRETARKFQWSVSML
ncbi:MAG: methyltransferase domain-containing protein, partial [Akkermansiaceae bacterium]